MNRGNVSHQAARIEKDRKTGNNEVEKSLEKSQKNRKKFKKGVQKLKGRVDK
jgi:hypothetical protein